MNMILNQYEKTKDRILPYLKGPLTYNGISKTLDEIRKVVDMLIVETPLKIQKKITNQVREYIPQKDLKGVNFTARIVMESLAVSVVVNEYFMTLTNLPKMKTMFWDYLEKDGLNFNIWSSIEKSLYSLK